MHHREKGCRVLTTADLAHLLESMNVDFEELTESTQLGPTGIGLDSLACMELALVLEEEHDVLLDAHMVSQVAKMDVAELLGVVNDGR